MARKSSSSSKKANAPLQPHAEPFRPIRKKRSAQASFSFLIAASLALAAIAPLHGERALALPVPPARTAKPSSSPTIVPDARALPYGARLTFVLDGTISSGTSHTNDLVHAHLKDPLVVAGTTIAPAGSPAQIRVLDASPASNPDIYGFVDIYFQPMRLADGRELPLRAPESHLNVNVSAGHESTAGVENTVGDIFAPTLLLHVFRKGRNFTLEPGAEIHALTEARIEVAAGGGTFVIVTPPPLVIDSQVPHSSFRAVPLASPAGKPLQGSVPLLYPSTGPTRSPFPGTQTPPPILQTPSPPSD